MHFDKGTLLVDVLPAGGIAPYWKWDSRVSKYRCDALHYADIAVRGAGCSPTYNHSCARWQAVVWPKAELSVLREDQAAAQQAWLQTPRGVVVMPTGTGKTEVALHIMHQLSVSTLVVVPVRDLMYQWQDRIQKRLGYDAGIIGDNTFNKRAISVTTYDSAAIYMQEFGHEFKLLILDECHHLPGSFRSDAARMSMAPYRLGLTATPERGDGREAELFHLIGPIVHKLQLSAARGVTLANYDVARIPVYLQPEERARYDGYSTEIRRYMAERGKTEPGFSFLELRKEWTKNPEARRILDAFHAKESIEDRACEKLRVLEDLFRLHPKQRMLIFTKTNVMAREVSARFLIPCLLNHSRKKERKEILEGFRTERYPAIVANQILDEGVDLPEAKIVVVLGGQASVKQAKQRLGRILRKHGDARVMLYEVVCSDTKEAVKSRLRRKSDAYEGTRVKRI